MAHIRSFIAAFAAISLPASQLFAAPVANLNLDGITFDGSVDPVAQAQNTFEDAGITFVNGAGGRGGHALSGRPSYGTGRGDYRGDNRGDYHGGNRVESRGGIRGGYGRATTFHGANAGFGWRESHWRWYGGWIRWGLWPTTVLTLSAFASVAACNAYFRDETALCYGACQASASACGGADECQYNYSVCINTCAWEARPYYWSVCGYWVPPPPSVFGDPIPPVEGYEYPPDEQGDAPAAQLPAVPPMPN